MSEPQPHAGTPAPEPAPAQQAGALLTWPEFLGRPKPEPDRTIRYGDHPRQVVDLYLPPGAGPHPVVVMIHGGCWSAPWDRTLMNHVSDDLRRRGIAVWNIDYRVIEEGGTGYPDIFTDTAAAADALMVQAGQYGLDLRKVVGVGHSAGGHLALWLAARKNLTRGTIFNMRDHLRLTNVVSLGGIPDLELAEQPPGTGCGTEVVGNLIGRGRSARRHLFADTSVPHMGSLGIPQVLINGTEDRIIPTFYAEDYAGKMRAKGDDVRVRLIERTGHVELIAPESAASAAAVEEIERALGVRR